MSLHGRTSGTAQDREDATTCCVGTRGARNFDIHQNAAGSAQDSRQKRGKTTRQQPVQQSRRRLTCKTPARPELVRDRRSYATSWDAYVDGNVVSECGRRLITNLLAATAAIKDADAEDSSEDSDAEQWKNLEVRVGNMEIVQQTLTGGFP